MSHAGDGTGYVRLAWACFSDKSPGSVSRGAGPLEGGMIRVSRSIRQYASPTGSSPDPLTWTVPGSCSGSSAATPCSRRGPGLGGEHHPASTSMSTGMLPDVFAVAGDHPGLRAFLSRTTPSWHTCSPCSGTWPAGSTGCRKAFCPSRSTGLAGASPAPGRHAALRSGLLEVGGPPAVWPRWEDGRPEQGLGASVRRPLPPRCLTLARSHGRGC